MKKKLLAVAMIAILVLLVACCVVACNPKNETVVNATLLEKGFYSIKEYYAKDEALDLNGATIKYYTDLRDPTTGKEITVTADMISGFSTATVGEDKTCTLTYKDKTLTYTYSVYEVQAVDAPIENNAMYITSNISTGKANAFIFDKTDKTVLLKEYNNYGAFKTDTAAVSIQSTYKYEIVAGGATVLSAKFNNVEHRFTNITADSFEHTVYGSGISQSGTAKKFDSDTFIEPSQTAYISQIVDSETNKYKAIKISEKSAEYSDRPDQYCIAVIDNDFNIKIYLSDTYVESSGISSFTPTFEIGVENSSFTASSVVWVKAFDGRNVSVQARKTGDFIYLHITRQANSSADPPIIGYIIDAYTYETIGQSGPTE